MAILDSVYGHLAQEPAARRGPESEMDENLRQGLAISVLHTLRSTWGLTVMELSSSVGIPKSTLMRLFEQGKRLGALESDRVYRLVSLLTMAEQAIGDRTKALAWMRQPNRTLGDRTPLWALETEIGARRVEQALGMIAYGGVS